MRNLPTKSQLRSTKDEPADGSQGDDHVNKSSNDETIDPAASVKKKGKSANTTSKHMSPVRQVMKAVTSLALNPPKRKVPKHVKTKGENQEPGSKDIEGKLKDSK